MSRSKRAKRNTRRKRAAQRAPSASPSAAKAARPPSATTEPSARPPEQATEHPLKHRPDNEPPRPAIDESPAPQTTAGTHSEGAGARRRARLRLARLWLIGAAIGTVTLACLVGGAAALLAQATPAWWVEPGTAPLGTALPGPASSTAAEPATAQSAIERGRAVEEAISRLLSSATPGTVTRTALYERDANAWLETRLPRWLEAEETPWPDEVSSLRVRATEGRMQLAVRVTTEGWSRVVTLTIEPSLDEQGRLWAPAQALHVGRLRLPLALILGEIETSTRLPAQWRDDPRTRFAVSVFAGESPLVESPVVRIDDRRLRLTELECVSGRFDLAYEVERRD